MWLFDIRPMVVGVLAVLGVAVVSGCEDRVKKLDELAIQRLEEQKTPDQRAADARRAAEDARYRAEQQMMRNRLVGVAKEVRRVAKNPKSFELVSILHVGKTDTVCMTYRGTNSFNAVVTDYLAVNASGKAVDWNANCANRKASDWTSRVLAAL